MGWLCTDSKDCGRDNAKKNDDGPVLTTGYDLYDFQSIPGLQTALGKFGRSYCLSIVFDYDATW